MKANGVFKTNKHFILYIFLYLQVLANVVLFIGVNVVGVYHMQLLDISQRRTFLDTRSCIESRVKLEHQQAQQVSLSLECH